jgi:endo-1,4-beta-xylanase
MKATLPLLLAPLVALVHSSPVVVQRQAADSIDSLYKGVGKNYFGTIAEKTKLDEGSNGAIIKSNFGQLTAEWSMKWEATEPSRGQFNFEAADALMEFAEANGKVVRGHALLWHIALPGWVQAITSKEELTEVIENHVTELVTRYKGRVRSWVRSSLPTSLTQSLIMQIGRRQ